MIKKKTNLTFFICLVSLLGLLYYAANSMLWTGSSSVAETKPAASSPFSVKDLVINKTINLSSDDVTSLIKLYSPRLENINCSIKDSKISSYMPIKYHGINLLLSIQGKLEYADSFIYYYPDYFKVGRLSMPKSIAFNYIKKYSTVNTAKKRIEIETTKLPVQIESLELKGDILQIKLGKIGANTTVPNPSSPSTQKPAADPSKTSKPAPSTNNTSNANSDMLKRTSSQLKTVYSKVKTSGEKQVIQQIQDTVSKMLQNSSYDYKSDASAIMSKYSKLTASEKSDLKYSIIMNMDIDTLLQLKDTFGL